MIYDIENEKDFDKEVGEGKGYVLVDLFATWCRPCKMMSPVLEDASEELDGKVRFCRMDVDRNEDIARALDIMGVPTMVVFKDGKEAGRIVGYHSKDAFYDALGKIVVK